MPELSIFLLTQMRRILPSNKMELDSCHRDVHLFWLSVNTQGYLAGIKKKYYSGFLPSKKKVFIRDFKADRYDYNRQVQQTERKRIKEKVAVYVLIWNLNKIWSL